MRTRVQTHRKPREALTLGARLANIVKDMHAPQEERDRAAAELIQMWGPKEGLHADPNVTIYDMEVVVEHGSKPYNKLAEDLIWKWIHWSAQDRLT